MKLSAWNEISDQTFDPSVLRTRIPVTLTSLEQWATNRIREA
jgi:hypothetical protein